jgi:hypothetical protein
MRVVLSGERRGEIKLHMCLHNNGREKNYTHKKRAIMI